MRASPSRRYTSTWSKRGCGPSIIDDGEAAPPQERYHIIADWAPPEQRRGVLSGFLVAHQRTRPPYLEWPYEAVETIREQVRQRFPEFMWE